MDDLLKAACAAKQNAYAPYSGFRVGASIRGAGGRIYSGCNIENSAYPESMCAEAAAIAVMIGAGEKCITEVLVVGYGEFPCPPCGGCRQQLYEFADGNTPVHMCSSEGLHQTVTLAELLPHAFGPQNLTIDEEMDS